MVLKEPNGLERCQLINDLEKKTTPNGLEGVMFVRVLPMFLSCNKWWTINIVYKQYAFILLAYNRETGQGGP